MKKITFAGAYGIKSQGDDAALLSIVEGLRRRIGDFEGVVAARHAAEDAYGRYGLRTVQNLDYESRAQSAGRWFRGFNPGDDRSALSALEGEIASSDLLVLGAGNFLVDLTIDLLRGPVPYFTVLTLMAKMSGTPVMWFGISAGPFRTGLGRKLTGLCAQMADVITLRDESSCSELKRLGYTGPFTHLPDPVLGLTPPPPAAAERVPSWRKAAGRPGPVVAVSVRDMPSGCALDTERYVKGMSEVCDSLAERYSATVLFIPQCSYSRGDANEDDRNVARLVAEGMRRRESAVCVEEDLTVDQCLSLYGKADVSICTRLHGNVFSAIQGTPSVAISYNPKVSGFMDWLGNRDLTVAIDEFSPERVAKKTIQALKDSRTLSERILSRVAEGRVEVERYADIAVENLKKRGDMHEADVLYRFLA